MVGLRPKTTALYLERPRLLRLLPEEAGYVVWLEAPYGYGKSVLTAQWAAQLEAQGWRVVWVATLGEDPKPLLARELELPLYAPWSIVLEALGAKPTLVILEDLEGSEPLSPLLKNPAGLVLLASRGRLPQPEIPRLMSEGRLVHVGAAALAFSLEEARQLFSDPWQAQETWNHTQGWSLPLHLAALTGEIPGREALLEGMRESLEPALWEEALLLSVLPYLPQQAASPLTQRLAEAGFAQALETGYRVHPLMAEALQQAHSAAIGQVVGREAGRLPPLLRGQALERCGLQAELGQLLETQEDLDRQDPEAVLRWDALAPLPRGWLRLKQVGEALCLTRRTPQGLELLAQAATLPGITPAQALLSYKEMVWYLASQNPGEARAIALQAEPLLGQVSPELAGRFLNDASRMDFVAGNLEAAQATLERALSYFPATSSRRLAPLMNLGILRWNRTGDLEGRLAIAEEALPQAVQFFPEHVPGIHLDLGRLKAVLGRREEALRHFQGAAQGLEARPWINLEAQAMASLLQDDFSPLPGLLARIRAWENPEALDRVRSMWAWALIDRGQAEAALRLLQEPQGFMGRVSKALALSQTGSTQAALDQLPGQAEAPEREPLLHWHAARYRITHQPEDLESLLSLTLSGAGILPALVPLSDLPPNRPDLALAYPLKEVLVSGWKEAIAARLSEVPPLEIEVLGRFQVRLMGQGIELAPRPKAILLLLLLGLRRDEIAEALWPGLKPEKSRNNLHVNLNFLRKSLEPWGLATYLSEEGLRRTKADLWELEVALQQGDVQAILGLYRGPLAPGESLPAVDEAREQLQQRVIDRLLAAQRVEGSHQLLLERVLELDPLNETALQRLLRLMVSAGQRTRALRRYAEFARRLREEMGLEPMPETRKIL